jgi:hypothetical protein
MYFVADIGDSFQGAMDKFFAWLPNLLGAVVIILVGWLIARVVAAAVRGLLRRFGADRAVEGSMVGAYKRQAMPTTNVSDLIGTIAFWFVFGTAILLALSALQIPLLDEAVGTVVGYLPDVVAAILILVVGFAVAGAVGALANRLAGDTMLGKIAQTAIPVIVVAIAISMALVQLQIAPEIVIATYVIALGAVGLGLALAFGLGGRDVASRFLGRTYQAAQERMPQMQAEAQTVKERGREAAAEAREKVEEAGQRPAGTGGERMEPSTGMTGGVEPSPDTMGGTGSTSVDEHGLPRHDERAA